VTDCDGWGEGVKKIGKSAHVVYGRPFTTVAHHKLDKSKISLKISTFGFYPLFGYFQGLEKNPELFSLRSKK